VRAIANASSKKRSRV